MSKPRRIQPLLQFDRRLQRQQRLESGQIAGLDEVGRGPLAGPVVASAVILRRFRFTVRIDDSKKLSPHHREAAYREIIPCADIGIGFVGAEEIDRIGIHAASHRAMLLALQHLPHFPRLALIDGLFVPRGFPVPAIPIVGGDGRSFSIACASIVAKVVRDRMMRRLHQLVPQYGFHRHKGYPTPEHLKALQRIGPTFFHRFSFHPVRSDDF